LANLLDGLVVSTEQVIIPAAYYLIRNVVVGGSKLVGIFTEHGALTGKEIIFGSALGVGDFGLA
jgi:hypothetical protein